MERKKETKQKIQKLEKGLTSFNLALRDTFNMQMSAAFYFMVLVCCWSSWAIQHGSTSVELPCPASVRKEWRQCTIPAFLMCGKIAQIASNVCNCIITMSHVAASYSVSRMTTSGDQDSGHDGDDQEKSCCKQRANTGKNKKYHISKITKKKKGEQTNNQRNEGSLVQQLAVLLLLQIICGM